MVLHLDSQFLPFKNTNLVQYESFFFSGGEPHIKIISDLSTVDEVTITHRIRSFNDFGMLLCAIDAVKRCGVEKVCVFIPYFPAARQDRVMVPGEPLTVKIFAEILNSQELYRISIFDPHSEVTPALLNNCEVFTNHTFIKKVMETMDAETLLISPDGGALKKIYKVSEFLGGLPVVECSKKRNVKNGKLEGFKVYEDDLQEKDCLIVDDMCDGGGTFIGLAKELKAKNAGNLYLAVSHGIFSKGVDELSEIFTKIFTTDSFRDLDGGNVSQIKLQELL